MKNNPLHTPLAQLLVVYGTFALVVLTVGREWPHDTVFSFFIMVTGGYGAYAYRNSLQQGDVVQTSVPTTPPEDAAMRDEIRQLEQQINALLVERDAYVYVFREFGLRVTVRPAR